MTSRCTPITRAAALLILALALFGAPTALRAQSNCACDHYTIALDATVTCNLTVCYQVTPHGPILCATIAPGGSLQIPCPVYQAGVLLCNGSTFVVIDDNPIVARCTGLLQIGQNCCVRACRSVDPAGCPLITVSPTPCLVRC